MKEQMKKLLGLQPPSLDMPLKLSQTFTKPIPLNLGLCHLLSLDIFTHSDNSEKRFTCQNKKSFLILYTYVPFLVYSSLSLSSDFSDSSPSNSDSVTLIRLTSVRATLASSGD